MIHPSILPPFHHSNPKQFLFCIWLLLLPAFSVGQGLDQKTEPDLARQVYDQHLNPEHLIKNGRAYEFYYPFAKGHQYTHLPGLIPSQIVIDGISYQDIPLNYDIFNDLVISSNDIKGTPNYIIINKERISEFFLKGFHFVRIEDSTYLGLEGGIYQLGYGSPQTKLLIRKKKQLIADLQLMVENKQEKFIASNAYYLVQGDTARQVSGKKQFLACFEDQDAIKSFIKRNKLKINPKQPTYLSSLVQVLTFAEGL